MPWSVELPKIFDNQRVFFNSIFLSAEDSDTFGVDPKMVGVLCRQIHDRILHNGRDFFILLCEFSGKYFVF